MAGMEKIFGKYPNLFMDLNKNGKKNGVVKWYDKNGNVIRKILYENGVYKKSFEVLV